MLKCVAQHRCKGGWCGNNVEAKVYMGGGPGLAEMESNLAEMERHLVIAEVFVQDRVTWLREGTG